MTRALKIKYKNALYHVTSRGNGRRNIFTDDNQKGHYDYWQALQSDLSSNLEIKRQIIGNSILGSEQFIQVIKEKHLLKKEKEIPSVKKIHSYYTKGKVIEITSGEIDKTLE